MPTLLHTADWQIGRQFATFAPDDAAILAETRFETVRRIAQLATAEAVDAVLVAGDVFDAQTVSNRTIGRLFNALEAFKGPWIMIPGNHDAALTESVWHRAERLGAIPPNVKVLLEPGVIELADAGLAVLAAPLTQRHTHDDLTAAFDRLESTPGLFRIGLAHGCVQGVLPDDIDSPNPIAPDRASRARLDYLALGDWHGCREIDARTWYAGTPEPDRFRNNDAGQALKVTLRANAEPEVVPQATGQFRWLQLEAQLAVASDLEQLGRQLDQLRTNDVVSLEVSGRVTLAEQQGMDALLRAAEARVRLLQVDRDALRMQPSDDDLAALQADGYVGEVLAELREHQEAPDGEVAGEALNLLAGLLLERHQAQGAA